MYCHQNYVMLAKVDLIPNSSFMDHGFMYHGVGFKCCLDFSSMFKKIKKSVIV